MKKSYSLADEFKKQPRLIYHPWPDPRGKEPARPRIIRERLAFLEEEREFFDGAFLFLDFTLFHVMRNFPLNYDIIVKELSPIAGLNSASFKFNFLLVFIDRPADLFDDWSICLENWSKAAKACRKAGLVGIAFDNEEYFGSPFHCEHQEKTFEEYQEQARLRGRQVMEAITKEWPDVIMMGGFHGPYISIPKGPKEISFFNDYLPKVQPYNKLKGPFYTGFFEGRGEKAVVIDGGELYGLHTEQDFKLSYDWQKRGLVSNQTNCPFIPKETRVAWKKEFSIGYGVIDNDAGVLRSPSLMQTTVENSIKACDHMVWLYCEKLNLFESGKEEDAIAEAVRKGKNAGLEKRKRAISSFRSDPVNKSRKSFSLTRS